MELLGSATACDVWQVISFCSSKTSSFYGGESKTKKEVMPIITAPLRGIYYNFSPHLRNEENEMQKDDFT